jgi:XapX domain-containing protein
MTLVFSLLAGLVIGAVFALLRLSVPAPPTIGGVVGIAGLALGAYFTNLLIERLS